MNGMYCGLLFYRCESERIKLAMTVDHVGLPALLLGRHDNSALWGRATASGACAVITQCGRTQNARMSATTAAIVDHEKLRPRTNVS
jgi:hypothetical protein